MVTARDARGRSCDVAIGEFVERHGAVILRAARRFSASPVDAEDAYQRALEILITKAPDLPDEELKAWTLTVVRNEALGQRRKQRWISNRSIEELAESLGADDGSPEELLLDLEIHEQSREALKRLNPDQIRCLVLRADGFGYPEICEITGFTYAKVNRCLSEGRSALRGKLALIGSGAECRRLEPVLSMIVDGAADAAAQRDAGVHLDGCLGCRTTLAEFRDAASKVRVLLPVGLLGQSRDAWTSQLADRAAAVLDRIREWIAGHSGAFQQASEISSGRKAAAVTAIAAALTAGGITVGEWIEGDSRGGASSGAEVSRDALLGTTAKRTDSGSPGTGERRPTGAGARAAGAADLQPVAAASRNGNRSPIDGAHDADVDGESLAPLPAEAEPSSGAPAPDGPAGDLAP